MTLVTRAGWRLRQAREWLRRRLRSPAVILMYHRVTELPNDPHLLAVTPEHFAEHLAAIRTHAAPVPLQELAGALRRGRVPARAVAITLDDGYADNLHGAKPLLMRHDVPATVFITAGQVGREREFWWDELDRLLLQPGTLPPVLRLRLNGGLREWPLEEASTYGEAAYQRDRGWNIECRDEPGPRQRVFRALFDLFYLLPSAERWALLDQVAAWAQAPPVVRPSHRTLTTDEVVRLAQGGLVEIGAHTVTHPVLAALPPAEQRREVQESKARLEAALGLEVASFAYPHGSCPPEAVASVGEAGFACACSSEPQVVFRDADRLRLPRLVVRDWDGATFARWLKWWLGMP